MDKFTIRYSDFLRETLEDTYKDKISENYSSLKRGILNLLDDSIDNEDELEVFIDRYIENPDSGAVIDFTENDDIFNFYLKFESNIDELCVDKEYFNKSPKDNDIFSLYDFIIEGTKFAFLECLKLLKNELF